MLHSFGLQNRPKCMISSGMVRACTGPPPWLAHHALKYSFDCVCSGNVEETATTPQVQLPAYGSMFSNKPFFFWYRVQPLAPATWPSCQLYKLFFFFLKRVVQASWYNYNHKARRGMCSLYQPKTVIQDGTLVSQFCRNMAFQIKRMLHICGAEVCTSISQSQYNNDNVIRKHNGKYFMINCKWLSTPYNPREPLKSQILGCLTIEKVQGLSRPRIF